MEWALKWSKLNLVRPGVQLLWGDVWCFPIPSWISDIGKAHSMQVVIRVLYRFVQQQRIMYSVDTTTCICVHICTYPSNAIIYSTLYTYYTGTYTSLYNIFGSWYKQWQLAHLIQKRSHCHKSHFWNPQNFVIAGHNLYKSDPVSMVQTTGKTTSTPRFSGVESHLGPRRRLKAQAV